MPRTSRQRHFKDPDINSSASTIGAVGCAAYSCMNINLDHCVNRARRGMPDARCSCFSFWKASQGPPSMHADGKKLLSCHSCPRSAGNACYYKSSRQSGCPGLSSCRSLTAAPSAAQLLVFH
ncbi:hypothetical protein GY45DRAFT_590717 [Cubamyces sp. BRFM 1775]|nr:hypothetical protein GY45DRAFT_590717 [Cubamyces sp. BRFM 1775]